MLPHPARHRVGAYEPLMSARISVDLAEIRHRSGHFLIEPMALLTRQTLV